MTDGQSATTKKPKGYATKKRALANHEHKPGCPLKPCICVLHYDPDRKVYVWM